MKLPLLAVLGGLLVGIAIVLWLQPSKPEGAALIMFVSIQVVAFVGVGTGKLVSLVLRRRRHPSRHPQKPRRRRKAAT